MIHFWKTIQRIFEKKPKGEFYLFFKIVNNFKSELVDVFSILYFLLKLTEKYETKLYVVSKSNCFES
jgi:hypothetical protein